ncbi:hypothetical protein AWB85_04645 [Mycobacteroides immunogenum]|uniref:2-oxoadipate dioxygenase/decarboxylase n=1 Tax=Mycobacteroides immunogenum TaxID=83262 RepID=A0A179VFT6_9MYCO|nr:hypothetical protein AWB85_04645 [Mycobacteroides immunogenum]
MAIVQPYRLRAEFAKRLSDMYAEEVPAYRTLLSVTREVNRHVRSERGADAERFGTIGRVGVERHGAIRLGSPREMADAARIFAAMGMYPVGFYDLRDAASAVPVVSTAFRPIDQDELARNPFRVFASMLVPTDRRFFNADLQRRLINFLNARTLFDDELLRLADRAVERYGLPVDEAEQFLSRATAVFRLSREPVDRGWYEELHAVSPVAADIGGVPSTHINHLTPRVLDIDVLHHRLAAGGIAMIDAIQGPPRWCGPDLLLRQTSFRALAETRTFREVDGSHSEGDVRVRFGEVEARGIAVTPAGRKLYDDLAVEVERLIGLCSPTVTMNRYQRNEFEAEIWTKAVPLTETELALDDLAYFTFRVDETRRPRGQEPPRTLRKLIEDRWVALDPIVYEDFLPKSAAGIFQSNLTSGTVKDSRQQAATIDAAWMEGVLGTELYDPYHLYDQIRHCSLTAVAHELSIDGGLEFPQLTPRSGGRTTCSAPHYVN